MVRALLRRPAHVGVFLASSAGLVVLNGWKGLLVFAALAPMIATTRVLGRDSQ